MSRPHRTSEQLIDRVIVIESTNDLFRIGRDLVDGLLRPFKDRNPSLDFDVEYYTPSSRAEFGVLLERIAADTQARGGRPVLHLEMHGLGDETGLLFASDEEMTWLELAPALTAINRASRNSLLVVLATCYGAAMKMILERPHDRAPVFGLIGPNDIITYGRFPKGFRAFYTKLLETGDGDRSLFDLNIEGAEKAPDVEYQLRTAEGAFRDRIRPVLAQLTSGKRKSQQIESHLTNLMGTPSGKALGLRASRKRVKDVFATRIDRVFYRVRDRYLMLDWFPEERARFSLRYEDCVPPKEPGSAF